MLWNSFMSKSLVWKVNKGKWINRLFWKRKIWWKGKKQIIFKNLRQIKQNRILIKMFNSNKNNTHFRIFMIWRKNWHWDLSRSAKMRKVSVYRFNNKRNNWINFLSNINSWRKKLQYNQLSQNFSKQNNRRKILQCCLHYRNLLINQDKSY